MGNSSTTETPRTRTSPNKVSEQLLMYLNRKIATVKTPGTQQAIREKVMQGLRDSIEVPASGSRNRTNGEIQRSTKAGRRASAAA